MTIIDPELQAFLQAQDISADDLFDASGMRRSDYQIEMKRLGKLFAIGVSACERKHRLRTRAGHCAQCNTARIAFIRRHGNPGKVYVAVSTTGGILTKIGCGELAFTRVDQLNYYAYGGRTDWRIVHNVVAQHAGQVEFEAHRVLRRDYKAEGTYYKNGAERTCYELFNCHFEMAIKAVNDALRLIG